MKRKTRNFLLSTSVVVAILAVALAYNSFYVVKEGHRGILLRFGQVISTADGVPPGLHAKVPISDDVKHIKTDVQVYEFSQAMGDSNDLSVSVKWKVINPYVFYVATSGVVERAQSHLNTRIFRSFQESRQIPVEGLNEVFKNQFGIEIVELESEVQDSS